MQVAGHAMRCTGNATEASAATASELKRRNY